VLRLSTLIAVALVLVVASPAAAGTVTLGALDPDPQSASPGQPAPDGSGYHGCDYVGAIFVPSLGSGGPTSATPRPDTVVPAGGGVLTSWTIADEPSNSVFRLAVTRFTADGVIVVSRSAPETVPQQNARVTFPTHIPVAEGDQIALDHVHSGDQSVDDCYYWTGDSNDFVYMVGDYKADGEMSPWTAGYGYGSRRVNLQATLETGDGSQPPAPAPIPGPGSAPASIPRQPKSFHQPASKTRHCGKRKGHRHRRCLRRRG
jgi:hypothetical protein